MKKINYLILLIFISNIAAAQGDFKNIKWGMTINQVKALEAGILSEDGPRWVGYKDGKPVYNGHELVYKNSSILDKPCDIYYEFSGGKLNKVRVVYRHLPNSYGYTEDVVKNMRRFSDIFNVFVEKKYTWSTPIQCSNSAYSGPDWSNPDNKAIIEGDWNDFESQYVLVQKMVREKRYEQVFYRLESGRSRVLMKFATKYNEGLEFWPAIMELSPSFEVENKMKSNAF